MKGMLLLVPPVVGTALLVAQGPERPQAGPIGKADAKISRTGTWTIDPMHSWLGFEIEHVGISKVRGRFNAFSGTFTDDEKDISKASVSFTAMADSVDTGVPPRDEHLRSRDFFDVERYPEFKFVSTRVYKRAKNYVCDGNLTMHGVTRPVSFPFTMMGPVRDGFGAVRRGIHGGPFIIDRRDFGISWQQMIPTGKTVADTVSVEFSIEATPQAGLGGEAPASATGSSPSR